MSQLTINVGQSDNDKSGDTIRAAFTKVNSNFTELYNSVAAEALIPSQTNQGGKLLSTNGSVLLWTSPPDTTSLNNGAYTLTLGSDGTINLPDAPGLGSAVIQPFNNGYGVSIVANGNVWAYGTNGSLTIPTGGVITDANSYLTTLNLYVQGSIKGVDGNTGSTGQVLTCQSNGGIAWATPSTGSSSSLVNGSYTFSLGSNGVVNVPTSQYNTAQVFSSTTNTTMCLGNSSHFIQVRGSDGAIVFPDYSVQTTAYTGAGDGVTYTSILDARSGDFTVTTQQLVLVYPNASARTITLPASPTQGQTVTIKKVASFSTASWNVNISGNGHNIDASSSVTITSGWGYVTLVYGTSSGVGTQWWITAASL